MGYKSYINLLWIPIDLMDPIIASSIESMQPLIDCVDSLKDLMDPLIDSPY